MKGHAIVLLSGGQDSTTCLGWAVQEFDSVSTLSLYYGQKNEAELSAAAVVARLFKVPNKRMELGVLAELGDSALLKGSGETPSASGGYEDEQCEDGLPTSFVPGRNLLFLSVAGAFAVKHGANHIVTGVCQTDYSGYPDCRQSFLVAMEHVLSQAMPSSCLPIQLHAPLMSLTKAETVELAHHLGNRTWAGLHFSVTCYKGMHPGCGDCPACYLRAKGFEEAGYTDPAFEDPEEPEAE